VALVQDEKAILAQDQGQLFEVEGQLVAHVRVIATPPLPPTPTFPLGALDDLRVVE
jgi:hypothetical protein